jgi:gas vesicle protein
MTMNDTSNAHGTPNTGLALMGFAVGAVVGAGLALLLAPDSGKRTRQRIGAAAQRWTSSAGNTLDQVRESVAELGIDAQSAVKAGKDAFLDDRAARGSRSERLSHAADAAPGSNAGQR